MTFGSERRYFGSELLCGNSECNTPISGQKFHPVKLNHSDGRELGILLCDKCSDEFEAIKASGCMRISEQTTPPISMN